MRVVHSIPYKSGKGRNAMPSSVGIADTFPPDLGGRQGGLARLGLLTDGILRLHCVPLRMTKGVPYFFANVKALRAFGTTRMTARKGIVHPYSINNFTLVNFLC
jgi:hypothetical protein